MSGEDWLWDADPSLQGAGCLPVADDVHVGLRLRERRQALGLSQQAMAFDLGISYQQIQKYELGHNRLAAGRLSLIARRLGVPPCYFFLSAGACTHRAAQESAQAEPPSPEYAAFLNRAQRLLAAFRRLPPDQQAVALRLTQTLTEIRPPQSDGPAG